MKDNRGKWLFKDTFGNQFFNECDKIVNDEILFKNFKQNSIFSLIIGNDVRGKNVSDILYDKIKETPIFKDVKTYKTNDLYGNPKLYNYPDIGKISSGTLYFMYLLNDIINKFGDINKLNVVEIGSGYGGQAKILLDNGVNHYTCVDVKQPLSLCRKYLELFNYRNVNYINTDELSINNFKDKYDLVISNWCLSEFDNEGIKYYIDNIIQFVDNGYFLMNISDIKRKNFLINELKKHFKIVVIEDEEVKTHTNNNFLVYVTNNKTNLF